MIKSQCLELKTLKKIMIPKIKHRSLFFKLYANRQLIYNSNHFLAAFRCRLNPIIYNFVVLDCLLTMLGYLDNLE